MRIENIIVKTNENSIFPSLIFELDISYINYQEAIIGISGWLESDDGKIIAEINEDIPKGSISDEVGASCSSFDSKFIEKIYKTTVITLLNKKALMHIEKRRMEERKGDVKLNLNLNVKIVRNRAELIHLYPIDPKEIGLNPIPVRTYKGENKGKVIVTAYDKEFSTSHINQWVISGQGSPVFLSVEKQ